MSERKPRILLTNDDGYFSDGIRALQEQLAKWADVYLVAPDREQSASSHSLTLNHPLRMHKLSSREYTTDGTPTDCVMLAIHMIFKKRLPDFIVSGINHGANMGDDVTYSGTVAAAIEGAILKVPSVAVSMANYEPGTPMKRAAMFASKFIRRYDKLQLDPMTFVNINFPQDDGKVYKNYVFTSQGSRRYKDVVIKKKDPRGIDYYWIGGRPEWELTEGTDFGAVSNGFVSITPMKLEFTDESALARLQVTPMKL